MEFKKDKRAKKKQQATEAMKNYEKVNQKASQIIDCLTGLKLYEAERVLHLVEEKIHNRTVIK